MEEGVISLEALACDGIRLLRLNNTTEKLRGC